MALLELQHLESKEQPRFTCETCSEVNKRNRKCGEFGFENIPSSRPIKIGDSSFQFCPAKAKWYPDMIELFLKCETAALTGILPSKGHFNNQDAEFAEVFPIFVRAWDEKRYRRLIKDGQSVLVGIVEALFGKKKQGRGRGAK